jgi:hypothetical protein
MNKQQGFSTLVGTVFTLWGITAAAGDNLPWRYDEESSRVIFAVSGPAILHPAVTDNIGSTPTSNLPWRYDEASRRVIFAVSGPVILHPAVADIDGSTPTSNLPWRYDEASRRVIFAFTGPPTRQSM